MREVTVSLGARSYPVFIGAGILSRNGLLRRLVPARQVMVVTNETVAPLYLETVLSGLSGLDVARLVLPDGEKYKNLEHFNCIVTALLERRFSRDACIVALGGGVIGDLAGFAAACYQRGIGFIQVPTTLLAQVDSAVGGKTAVNHPLGKNMIGAFHQPRGVIADTRTLDSLPGREFSAGLAEVIKYGLIRDAGFFEWLELNMDRLAAREQEALEEAVERSCRNKAAVVAEDETEAGQRAVLNLGHTFAHAVETALGYEGWLHGEAVGLGLLMATDLSSRMGWLDAGAAGRLRSLLERAGLPVTGPAGPGPSRIRELMSVDKKSRSGGLRLVLLQDIGRAVISDQFDESLLGETLSRFLPAAETG